MEKSNKSLLWEYFEKLPDGSGRCKTCKKQIACTSGNTTGLGRHLTSGGVPKNLTFHGISKIDFQPEFWNSQMLSFPKM